MVIRQGADLGGTEHILTVEGLEPLFWMLIVVHRTLYDIFLICFTSDALVFFFVSQGVSQISQLLRPVPRKMQAL